MITTTDGFGQPKEQTRQAFIQRHALPLFFILVFALTWPFMIVDALGSHELLPFRLPIPLLLVMSYMPTAAALIVSGLSSGRTGIRMLLRAMLIWRVGIGWYLVAIVGFAGICLSAVLLTNLLGSQPPVPLLSKEAATSSGWALAANIVLLFVVSTVINGEELAWRGFALPRLQAKMSALAASVILGLIWALFHLPLFFTLTGTSQADASLINFLFATVGLSVIFTWLYNNTQGSLLLPYLLHGAVNTWPRIFPIDHGSLRVSQMMTVVICLCAVAIVLFCDSKDFVRHGKRIQQPD